MQDRSIARRVLPPPNFCFNRATVIYRNTNRLLQLRCTCLPLVILQLNLRQAGGGREKRTKRRQPSAQPRQVARFSAGTPHKYSDWDSQERKSQRQLIPRWRRDRGDRTGESLGNSLRPSHVTTGRYVGSTPWHSIRDCRNWGRS